jgi:exopolysaccharide biosynthesis protein
VEVLKLQGDVSARLMVIHNPKKVQIGYSSKLDIGNNTNNGGIVAGEKTSEIAKRNNAIGAINAGGFKDVASGGNLWTGTGGLPMGFIIHNGEVIYNQFSDTKGQDTVAFDSRGMLIVGTHSVAQLKKLNVKEGVSFGPALIVNGKKTSVPVWGPQPRTAIGQKKNGEVLLLVVDGRSLKTMGATLQDLQDILLQYGAVNAGNLDGGSSATMYYNGKIINRPSDTLGERNVPTAFIVMP